MGEVYRPNLSDWSVQDGTPFYLNNV